MTIHWDRSGGSPKNGLVRPNSGIGRFGRQMMMAGLVLALVGAPSASFAGEEASKTGREGGLGAAAALSSLIYGPVKLIYATGGLVIGAFAWAFTAGDSEVAGQVFTRSLRGTYVITPDILTGEEELVFIGRDVEEPRRQPEAIASVSPVTTESADESGYDEMGW
jgi:hypothetical protein